MKRIVVIDAQGGGIGKQIIAGLKARNLDAEIVAIGTNSLATQAMLKAGASSAATGENAVVVASRKADIIAGPVGIVVADSMMGEVTPAMAVAVGQSDAIRVLVPINRCSNIIAFAAEPASLGAYISNAVDIIEERCTKEC